MRGNMVWVAVCLGQMTMGCTDKVGENTAPTAEITSPSESDEVFAHYPTLFSGQVSDAESDSSDLSVIWYEGERAICGPVNPESDGSTSCEMVLTETENYVNLEVTDPEGAVAVASYDVEVSPTAAPEVTIVTPNAEGMYYKNYAVAFLGRITDGEDEASGLTALWTGDVSG